MCNVMHDAASCCPYILSVNTHTVCVCAFIHMAKRKRASPSPSSSSSASALAKYLCHVRCENSRRFDRPPPADVNAYMDFDAPNNVFAVNPMSLDKVNDFCAKGLILSHQAAALLKMKSYLDNQHRFATVVMPTGTGKSGVAVLACYVMGANNVLVVTPAKVITDQIHVDFCGSEFHPPGYSTSFIVKRKICKLNNAKCAVPLHRSTKANKSSDVRIEGRAQTLLVANAHKFGTNSAVDLSSLDPDFWDFIIVDEAHHYQASTWQNIIAHFTRAHVLFLTATPNPVPALLESVCFEYKRQDAVAACVIRDVEFQEARDTLAAVELVRSALQLHDTLDPSVRHKAMVLTHYKNEARDAAQLFTSMGISATTFVEQDPITNLETFQVNDDSLRVLVVCMRCLEGFDFASVSVAVILRNVHPSSQVLFTQFVGRAVRRVNGAADPVSTAIVISTREFNQRDNFNRFISPSIAPMDPDDIIDNE